MSNSSTPRTCRYSFELTSLHGEDVTAQLASHRWLCLDSFYADGNSLEELLSNCSGITQDQDGGEGPEIHFDDLTTKQQRTLQVEIEERIAQQLRKDLGTDLWIELRDADRPREED